MGMKKILLCILLFLPLHTKAGREVDHIEILAGGHYTTSVEDTEGYSKWCRLFNPTKEQLVTYFAVAREDEFGVGWIHEYYSPCITSGTVTFKDGSYGIWGLHDSGLGSVYFEDKVNAGKKRLFLHLDNAWDDK